MKGYNERIIEKWWYNTSAPICLSEDVQLLIYKGNNSFLNLIIVYKHKIKIKKKIKCVREKMIMVMKDLFIFFMLVHVCIKKAHISIY